MQRRPHRQHRLAKWSRAGLALPITLAAALTTGAASGAPAAQAPKAAAGTVTIGGKCLDDADFGTGNGNVIQVFTCNGASAQKWTWESDGRVTVYGKCLDVTGGSNADGALVQLYSCTSGARQQKFKFLPDGTIYSAKSGKCLAVQGGSVVNNARIGLAPCDPAQPTQKWNAPTAPAPTAYNLSAGAAVEYQRPDDTPASVYTDKNGKFYYGQAHALYAANDPRKWSFYSGKNFDESALDPISSAVNPANPLDRNDDTTWRCNNSPTGKESTPTPKPSGYSQPNYCDISGIWVDPDSGDWYGLVHNEFTPRPFGDGMHYDGIDYAVSKDQGKTWNIKDHAITSPFSTKRDDTAGFPNETYHYGDGDQRLFVDNASGYFYAFYASRVLNKSGGGAVWLQHVARAPISQKMAKSSWKKWFNGAWQSPGTGGQESNIIPSEGVGTGYTAPDEDYKPTTKGKARDQVKAGTLPDHSQLAVMNVAWNAYLGKYIGTPQNNIAQATDTKTPLRFYATDDLATQKWTDIGAVDSLPNASWYRWFLDSKSLTSSTVLGKTFRSYCSFYCSKYDGEYADVTIAPKSAADLPQAPVNATGSYRIAAGNGLSLAQRGGGLATTPANGAAASQKWRFTSTGDGFWTIANAATGQVLGVDGSGDAGRAWGAAVRVGTKGATPEVAQQWSFQKVVQAGPVSGPSVATGEYRLVNRYSGLTLSLNGKGKDTAVTAPQRGWNATGEAVAGGGSASAQLLTFGR
ncbi:hypothetical protein GCM10010329_61010 [Streptomyces spiroverticillatus]|uniref:Ricin B lectin domain-containing protein n=1 Tax=Streptomyces finlayi TaxID=67296 RepID=A0A918X4M6_9ACTN|nr:ricin-type beta-trefoil lectin domain protein [Streptomyces finlayi]GHA29480.1 hypothetical protein GCM10010329_61010 [Streptomyces spiroverticillatus]GHD09895.1 hypothetical protein GCM10010334_64670 [Streptomyces finlayi]